MGLRVSSPKAPVTEVEVCRLYKLMQFLEKKNARSLYVQ